MTTPDNTEQPNEEVQELTDENLEEAAGGINRLFATSDEEETDTSLGGARLTYVPMR